MVDSKINSDKYAYQRKKDLLAERIAGEIALSDEPGKTIKKWRSNFDITQIELANKLNISPSVVSDYESGRRSSPGINILKRLINGMIEIDTERGGEKVKNYGKILGSTIDFDAILDMNEYKTPISFDEFCETINGDIVTNKSEEKNIHGHTVVDSLKAIIELSHGEFQQLYGWSSERALIFTGVTTGKSPLVAIRVTSLKPRLVVLHGLDQVSKIAKKIAKVEKIPLVVTNEKLSNLISDLSDMGR
ncbi:MAG: putative transcriptional regulator [Candidatus Methanohalarchaeum thermophilum]|uniref:Transcriptional regulator n=1 Tax=Methanohalarchaeum thermophilum TaxID=1903181 RepID=A0A1Q6DTX6_METT1|nr:MAG: putative transcriptional regulator [Candidatus Methanohalarchaeum thermophilum]